MKAVREYEGREVAIATMHGKERVMEPLLRSRLGAVGIALQGKLNTDSLGTFTGEVKRRAGALAVARRKCWSGMLAAELEAAVASEGSFGADPVHPFLAVDEEWVVFVDARLGLEVVGHHATHRTNFAAARICDVEELEGFAQRALFPSHALMVRASDGTWTKGIATPAALHKAWEAGQADGHGPIHVETDMRAMYNPTRMEAIGRAMEDLVSRLESRCPRCETPGFGVVRWVRGLPCSWCGGATEQVMAAMDQCPSCAHQRQRDFPFGLEHADPTYCPQCNP